MTSEQEPMRIMSQVGAFVNIWGSSLKAISLSPGQQGRWLRNGFGFVLSSFRQDLCFNKINSVHMRHLHLHRYDKLLQPNP